MGKRSIKHERSIYLSRNVKLELHSANSLVSFGRSVEKSRNALYAGCLSSNTGEKYMIFDAKPGCKPWGCISIITKGLISVRLNLGHKRTKDGKHPDRYQRQRQRRNRNVGMVTVFWKRVTN